MKTPEKDDVSTDELCLSIRAAATSGNIIVAYHSDWRPPPGRVLKPLSDEEKKRLAAYKKRKAKP